MKALPVTLAAVTAALCAGCFTPSIHQSNHWRIESIGPRISYVFFGYDGTKDGSGWEYTKRETNDLGKTLRRRLLNSNPDNPLTND